MAVSLDRITSTVVVAGIALAAMGFGTSLAATPPASMTQQEHRALTIRSQALNDLYGAPEVTSQYKAMVRADRIRGEAMNRLARSGVFSAPIAASTDTVAGDRFDWSDFGIGAGTVLGLVLLASGLVAGAHYTSKNRVRTRPAA